MEDSIREYIYEQVTTQKLSKEKAKELLIELMHKEELISESVAVIGMSCRFAGADNTIEFWDNLKSEKCTIGEFPYSRIDNIQESSKWESKYGTNKVELGGYIHDIDLFDPNFFRISPREAEMMHPAQKIILETAYEAFEDGGYSERKIVNTRTGVYIGIDSTFNSQYKELIDSDDMLALTGSVTGILAGRISYVFGLQGPSIVVDTACSSGLVAVHTAVNALKTGDCDMAIAGGIHVEIFPKDISQKNEIESSGGMIKAFDNGADGTVWGEGAGVVLLKPLKKALKDRDNIYAVIKGSAVNSDGATNGLTAPNVEAQANVIEMAWKNAGIKPETISYIETHGTGTLIGDPIEVKGISNAFRKYTDRRQFCGIGSVKCNIGHTVGASGIASFIKVVLALKNKEIPASINFRQPNCYIDFCDTPVYLNDRLKKWKGEGTPRRAGVSAFGFSGTNCHIVLEEAAEYTGLSNIKNKYHIFNISAKQQKTLFKLIEKYIELLNKNTELDVNNLCYTANTGRGHYRHRLSIVFSDVNELKSILKNIVLNNSLEFIGNEKVGYSEHNIVQDEKYIESSIDITEKEIIRLSAQINSKMEEILPKTGITHDLLLEISNYYIKAADIDWRLLYKNSTEVKVSIPIYPFDNRPYFLKKGKQKENKLKPLIDRCLSNSVNESVYLSVLEREKDWVLKDHMISEKSVLPGTTYLEMALYAIKDIFKQSKIELKDVVFIEPLVFYDDTPREVHTVIKTNKAPYSFTVASKSEDGEWVIHAEGIININSILESSQLDINEIKRALPIKDTSGCTEQMGRFTFGPRWFNIVETFLGEGEALAELSLPKEFISDLEEFKIHPALMDNAVNIMVQNNGDNLYLPFSYGSIKIYDYLPARFYSYTRLNKKDIQSDEILSFDINLLDEKGNVIVEISDYYVKKVQNPEMVFNAENEKLFYQIGWKRTEVFNRVQIITNKNILLFKGDDDKCEALQNRLCQQGNTVIEVVQGDCFKMLGEQSFSVGKEIDDYYRLFEVLYERHIDTIIHMFTLHRDHGKESFNELGENLKWGVYSLFYIAKALVKCRISQSIDLLLISEYANSVIGDEKTICPCNAAFLALGSAVGQEHPNLLCKGIDIDENTSVDKILEGINLPYEQYLTAYRKDEMYIREIWEANISNANEVEAELENNGAYVIAGGFGGIGFEIAKYLSSLVKVNLIFINRTIIPERKHWNNILSENKDSILCRKIKAIYEIEQMGSNIELYSSDISDRYRMEDIFNKIRDKYGSINGIIHCAGVAGDGYLMKKEEETFTKVLAPKIYGTKVLDELTSRDNLDFFVLFSSTASFLVEDGQGDYAAANAYQDSYAVYRNKSGKKTLCINWPAWMETGMAADYGVNIDGDIFCAIDNKTAVTAFKKALSFSIANVIISKINSSGIGVKNGQISLKKLGETTATILSKNGFARELDKVADILLSGRNDSEYTENEIVIGRLWSEVLGSSEINIYKTFYSYGGDSIQSIQLYKLLEDKFTGILDITDIFDYPTIYKMAGLLSQKLGGGFSSKTSIDTLLDKIERGEISIDQNN